MSEILKFDEKAVRQLEVTYRSPEVTAQRKILMDAISPQTGERALDIGCGPGFVAELLAEAVGPQGSVHGMDNSESSITVAQRRCRAHKNVTFEIGEAAKLPYPEGRFDVAISTQVYEFVAEIDEALAELFRVLRPGGRTAIIDTDWHTILWHSNDPARMARFLRAWDEHLVHPTLPRTLGPRLRATGFTVRGCRAIPYVDTEYKPEGYNFNMTGTIRRYVQGRQGITQQEADAWAEDLRNLAAAGGYFFCLNRFLFLAEKP